jgi:hypothetical protein
MKKIPLFFAVVLLGTSFYATAQYGSKVFFTSAIGLIKAPGKLGKVFQPSIALNSGIELTGKKNWFVQGTLDFNTLKYNQQIKEDGSPYLFQNTGSSLIMLAINAGKNFCFGNNKWFASLYSGGGYLNIGEPRLLKYEENTFKQKVSRMGNIFGKAGTRLGYKTATKLLQTIYADVSWWQSPLKVQGSAVNGFSFFLGLRMKMK